MTLKTSIDTLASITNGQTELLALLSLQLDSQGKRIDYLTELISIQNKVIVQLINANQESFSKLSNVLDSQVTANTASVTAMYSMAEKLTELSVRVNPRNDPSTN